MTYLACPNCKKKLKKDPELGFYCQTEGKQVEPEPSYLFLALITDPSD